MCALKRIVPVMLVSFLALNCNHHAFAGLDTDQVKLEENRKQLLETNSCPGCDLSGLNLERVNLTGANLEGANLSHVRFHLATLDKANLRNTDLRDAQFGGADLADADLRGADLRGASFAGAYLVGAQVDNEVVLNQPSEELASDTDSVQDSAAGNTLPVQEEQGIAPVAETREDPIEVAVQDQPSEITKNEDGAPSGVSGLFDQTWKGVKGFFGQGEGGENKAVTEQRDETGRSDGREAAVPAEQTVSQKDVVADIVPVQKEQSVEGVPSSAEPGFFDKAVERVKGLFGRGESVDQEAAADLSPSVPEERSVSPVESQTPAAPAAVEGTQTANTEPAGAENKDGGTQEEKPSPDNERDGVMLSAEKADPALEIEKNRQGLLDSNGCYGCNLRGVDLTGKDLDGADLEGADLTGSRLEGASLENANLKGAILVGVDLRNADLRGADLYKANLSGADLTGTRLEGADLDEAQLPDTLGYEQK